MWSVQEQIKSIPEPYKSTFMKMGGAGAVTGKETAEFWQFLDLKGIPREPFYTFFRSIGASKDAGPEMEKYLTAVTAAEYKAAGMPGEFATKAMLEERRTLAYNLKEAALEAKTKIWDAIPAWSKWLVGAVAAAVVGAFILGIFRRLGGRK